MAAVARRGKTTRAEKTTADAVASVSGLTPKSAMDKLSAAKQAIADKLAEVDAAVLERIAEMKSIDLAIEQRKQELKDLQNIEADAETLDKLKAELEQFRADLDAEKQKLERDHNEMIENRAKQWKREEDDHKFEIAQRNKRAEDMLKAESEKRQLAEQLRTEGVNRNLEERTALVVEREKKMTDLEAEIAGLPKKLEDGIKTAVAQATAELKTKYEHAATVEKMNLDAQNKLLAAEIAALRKQLDAVDKARAEAVQVAEKARAEVNEIAREAVQASSGREALKAVQAAPAAQPVATGRGR